MWLSASAFFFQYFRVYSPVAFGKKTDKDGNYIRYSGPPPPLFYGHLFCTEKVVFIRDVLSLEGVNLVVFYYLSSSEIWTGKVGRALLEGTSWNTLLVLSKYLKHGCSNSWLCINFSRISQWRGVLNMFLGDKTCQWLVTSQWFPSLIKPILPQIIKLLLKLAFNTENFNLQNFVLIIVYNVLLLKYCWKWH